MTCESCQHHNKRLKKTVGSLHPVPVKSKFWSQVGMDIIGPVPVTTQGNKKLYNWASEVSPTLGCSIEISHDISESAVAHSM